MSRYFTAWKNAAVAAVNIAAVAAADCSQSTDDECGIFAHRDLVHEIDPCEFHELTTRANLP